MAKKSISIAAEARNHDVHKYERVKLGSKGFEVYKCILTNCPHWIRQELVVNKLTICHRCSQEVVMTKLMARMKKPHCFNCTREYVRQNPPPKRGAASSLTSPSQINDSNTPSNSPEEAA